MPLLPMPDTMAQSRIAEQLKQLAFIREKWTAELQTLIGRSPDQAHHLTQALEDLDRYIAHLEAETDRAEDAR